MQILRWLFKIGAQEPPTTVWNSTSIPPKQRDEGEKMKSKNTLVVIDGGGGRRRHLKGVKKSKLNCDDVILFRFMRRKDVSKPFFYQTLNLKGVGSFFDRSRSSEKTMKRSEEILGGNKVLPIADSADQSSSRNDDVEFIELDEKDKTKNCRKKTVSSRMKELLKWSATAKVMNLKNGLADDGQVSDESPKISIRWEMEGCSTTTTTPTPTTVYTTISTVLRASSTLKDDRMQCADTSSSAAGIGNWITTDSEFVVLEL